MIKKTGVINNSRRSLEQVEKKAEEAESALFQTANMDGEVRLLGVRYDGTCFANEPLEAGTLKYKTVWRVRERDVVLSNINAVNGAIGVVQQELDGCFVSPEYTVVRAKDGVDPYVLQAILRTPESRADLLLNASGIGRHRITVESVSNVRIPYPKRELAQKFLADLASAREYSRKSKQLFEHVNQAVSEKLAMDTDSAREILKAFKPPK